MAADAESRRLAECRAPGVPRRKWGPYLSERQWGTVREDYSNNGDAWSYFSHDHARSRAYWRDCLLFYEYFHGDNGAGIGTSHQTGWTAWPRSCSTTSAACSPEMQSPPRATWRRS